MSQTGIAEYMNSRSTTRQFNKYEIGAIVSAIRKEFLSRKAEGIEIDGKTKAGRMVINQRVAEIANSTLRPRIPLKAEDVRLYKQCWAQEFMDRTGKCAWGFAETRRKLGYDPQTGLELAL